MQGNRGGGKIAHTGPGRINAAKRPENILSLHAGLTSAHLYPQRASLQRLEEVAIFQMPKHFNKRSQSIQRIRETWSTQRNNINIYKLTVK